MTDGPRKVKKKLLEKDIEGTCVRKAKSRGYWVRKFASPGKRSVPDRIFKRFGGDGFFVEFKAAGKKPTMNQHAEHQAMRDAGWEVHVCDSVDQFDTILDRKDLINEKGWECHWLN